MSFASARPLAPVTIRLPEAIAAVMAPAGLKALKRQADMIQRANLEAIAEESRSRRIRAAPSHGIVFAQQHHGLEPAAKRG